MKIIAISGKAQHGKDTVAAELKRQLKAAGKRVVVTHNADLLKFICKNYFDWDGQKDERGRTLLQYVGTDVIRKQNPDFWVGFIVDILRFFDGEWDFAIIPDTRFPNEIEVLRTEGFDVTHLQVVRPGFCTKLTVEQQNHPSETALDGTEPDERIVNDGSLNDLQQKISQLVKEYMHET